MQEAKEKKLWWAGRRCNQGVEEAGFGKGRK
jgi:hypothetical protein